MKESENNQTSTPLARLIPVEELTGRIDKHFIVPPGRIGVVIDPAGNTQTFAEGRHRAASFVQRLSGRSTGQRIGYVPRDGFTAVVQANYVLSGDEVLMDASLLASIRIVDPARFLLEYVLPRGEVRGTTLALDAGTARQVLAPVIRCYAAADLVAGLPTNRLVAEIQPALEAVLSNIGLAVAGVQLLSFSRSDERALIAEKVFALEERLKAVEVEGKMAAEERQAALAEFTENLQAEMGGELGLRPVAGSERDEPGGLGTEPFAIQTIRGWVDAQKESGNKSSWWNLRSLFEKKPAAEAEPVRPVRRPWGRWWTPGVPMLVFLIGGGYVATRLVLPLKENISPEIFWGLITAIWSIALPFAIDALSKMLEKREKLAQATWLLPAATTLEELVKRDRAKTDHLVRQQCQDELARAANALDSLITRVYQTGQIDVALQLRRLKQAVDVAQDTLKQPAFGAPAYLNDNSLSKMAWNRMLDYEEQILLEANALSEKILRLQQPIGQGVFDPEQVNVIQQNLDHLVYNFGGRSLALKNTASQK